MTENHLPCERRAIAAWDRVRRLTRDLFEALADLDEAGGVDAVIEAKGWRHGHFVRACGSMRLVRAMLRSEMDRIQTSRERGW